MGTDTTKILNLDESFENAVSTEVIGWGSRLSVGIGLVPVLRKATVVAVSNQVCGEAMGAGRISERMICAGAGGTDTCQGDSGGAMTSRVLSGGWYSLAGRAS